MASPSSFPSGQVPVSGPHRHARGFNPGGLCFTAGKTGTARAMLDIRLGAWKSFILGLWPSEEGVFSPRRGERRTVAATRTDSITRARTDLQGTCGTGEKESNNNNNNDHGKKTGKEP